MNPKFHRPILFEVFRDGKLSRAFSSCTSAMAYLALAKELRPDCVWTLREVLLGEEAADAND